MQSADYVRIPLRRRDGTVVAHALVSPEDAHLAERRWHRDNRGYARRMGPDGKVEQLHRVVLGLTHGDALEADHINGDKLDNRRSNLRVVTHRENLQNLRSRPGAASRFRGVQWRDDRRCWRARLGRVSLGYFHDELEAALAVERYRVEHLPFANQDPELTKVLDLVRRVG